MREPDAVTARIEARRRVMYSVSITPTARLLYQIIDDRAGNQGRMWYRQDKLAVFVPCSVRQLRTCLSQLSNFVRVERSRLHCVYVLSWLSEISTVSTDRKCTSDLDLRDRKCTSDLEVPILYMKQVKQELAKLLSVEISQMQASYPRSEFAAVPVTADMVARIIASGGLETAQDVADFAGLVAARFRGLEGPARYPGASNGPRSPSLLVNWAADYRLAKERRSA